MEAWITRQPHSRREAFDTLSVDTSDKLVDPALRRKEISETVDRVVGHAVVRVKTMWTGSAEVGVPWLSRTLPWGESGARI